MGMLSFYGLEGGILNLGGIVCYPKGLHPYGNDVVLVHYQQHRAEMLISLMDTWVMNPEEYPLTMCWVPWYPVDHDPMPQIVRSKISQAFRRISISKFGAEKTREAGLDCYYIPHGVDTNIFKPGDKNEARERLGWPKDKYIVLTVAMNKGNPSRKNFCEMAQAFADFKKIHTDAVYYLQTARGEGANDMINIPELMRNLGLIEGQDWLTCNPYQQLVGFPPQYMVDLYRAADVMMLVSAGEGFGIPILEAQACGCPVITSGWTANQELCFAGHLIDKSDALAQYTALASYQFKPHPRAIEIALHAEYKKPTNTAKAVEIVRAEYDADILAATKWKPILAEIGEAWQEHLKAHGWKQ